MSEIFQALTAFQTWLVLLFITAFGVSIALMVKGHDEFSVEDVQETADQFADNIIQDAHGPVTTFIWVTFIAFSIWGVAYVYVHTSDFASLFF